MFSTFSYLRSLCGLFEATREEADGRFRLIWFAVRTSSVELDRSCRGMDILTLVIVMGQGVADIVVFGKPLSSDHKAFTNPQASLKLSMSPYQYRV
jgi:hypothetical protein